jgi:hypothetical protein
MELRGRVKVNWKTEREERAQNCEQRREWSSELDWEKPRAEGVVESYEELESRKIERESERVSWNREWIELEQINREQAVSKDGKRAVSCVRNNSCERRSKKQQGRKEDGSAGDWKHSAKVSTEFLRIEKLIKKGKELSEVLKKEKWELSMHSILFLVRSLLMLWLGT